jgi:hypothetical protein
LAAPGIFNRKSAQFAALDKHQVIHSNSHNLERAEEIKLSKKAGTTRSACE